MFEATFFRSVAVVACASRRAERCDCGRVEIGERGILKARAKLRRKMSSNLGEPLCLAWKVGVSARGAREEIFHRVICGSPPPPETPTFWRKLVILASHPLSAVER